MAAVSASSGMRQSEERGRVRPNRTFSQTNKGKTSGRRQRRFLPVGLGQVTTFSMQGHSVRWMQDK